MYYEPRLTAQSQSLVHLAMVVIATSLEAVYARPCVEGGDSESCFPLNPFNEEVFPIIHEDFYPEHVEAKVKRKYDTSLGKKEMSDISSDDHRNCTGCDYESDVVDREDHATQYLAELMVNTDSEITSLEGSDVEETRDQPGGKDDGFFAFLTGEEKILEIEGVRSVPAKTVVK